MNHRNFIQEVGIKAGFTDLGVTGVGFSYNSAKRLLLRKKQGEKTPFVPGDIVERVTPKKHIPWAKSVLVCTYPFPKLLLKMPKDYHIRGRISRSAWGKDYHKVLGEKLVQLGDNLIQQSIINSYRTFVDTSPLSERELAHRAGVGSFGKNNSIISSTWGSFVFIGGLFVDKALPQGPIILQVEDEKVKCLECNRCVQNCPGNALGDSGHRLRYWRCISYLTVKKGVIPVELRPLMEANLYGCDKCLDVCPLNNSKTRRLKPSQNHDHAYLEISPEKAFPRLDFIMGLSNREFNEIYGDTAIHWRGKSTIQRNAAIAIGNIQKPQGIDILLEALEDKGEMVVLHGLWSIGRLYAILDKEKKKLVREKLENLKPLRKDIWSEELEAEYNQLISKINFTKR